MNCVQGMLAGTGAGLMSEARGLTAGLALCVMMLHTSPAWAQSAWPGYPSNTVISVFNDNVGIGTTSPNTKLMVNDLGTTDAVVASFYRNVTTGSGTSIILGRAASTGEMGVIKMFPNSTAGRLYLGLWGDSPSGGVGLSILKGGNVGIGTTNPQHKLAVNGVIGAKDVIVTNTGWSDYVFQPGYRLKPLSEVDAFIQANRHLPEIPSEAEVKAKGVSVGEIQAKLLAKIEELTLHMIRQERENGELRQRLAALESRAAGQ